MGAFCISSIDNVKSHHVNLTCIYCNRPPCVWKTWKELNALLVWLCALSSLFWGENKSVNQQQMGACIKSLDFLLMHSKPSIKYSFPFFSPVDLLQYDKCKLCSCWDSMHRKIGLVLLIIYYWLQLPPGHCLAAVFVVGFSLAGIFFYFSLFLMTSYVYIYFMNTSLFTRKKCSIIQKMAKVMNK